MRIGLAAGVYTWPLGTSMDTPASPLCTSTPSESPTKIALRPFRGAAVSTCPHRAEIRPQGAPTVERANQTLVWLEIQFTVTETANTSVIKMKNVKAVRSCQISRSNNERISVLIYLSITKSFILPSAVHSKTARDSKS